MQTIREKETITLSSPSGFPSSFQQIPDPATRMKRLKISEFRSWAICFAIVTSLTGLLKFLQVGVTMGTVTSSLFYLSLAGMIWFISKIIILSKTPVQGNLQTRHGLN